MSVLQEQELVALVESMRHSALGHLNDTLTIDRQQALDHYFGRKYGNEVAGRSQVVERTLMEVVEWMMPPIMESVCTADMLAKFEPIGANDVRQAEIESRYINWLIMERNDGFMALHDAIKDALLLKNGYIKRYWEDHDEPELNSYQSLDEEAITALMAELEADNDKVEIKAKEKKTITDPAGQQLTVYDLQIRVTNSKGHACIEAVPAEEILISPRCRGDIQKADFFGHIPRTTRTDLINRGMDKDFVESLPKKGLRQTNPDELARDTVFQNTIDAYVPNNPAMDEIDYLEAYVRVDWDGDGVAELRRVVLCGGRLPPGPEWNEECDEIPFSYGVPVRMAHRHIGISMDDFIQDLQLIRTTILRQGLDNVYLSNNQRPVISNKVNLDDVELSAPGSPYRVDTDGPVSGHIEWAQPAPILQQIMPILDYLDDRKEQRTGIGKNNTIIDPNVIRDSANDTITQAFNAANQRVMMVIRMIGETLIKDLVRGVHGSVVRYQKQPDEFQFGDQWIPIDPRSWRNRSHVTVQVGIGMGSAAEQRANLMFIGKVQQGSAAAGIVLPNNVYNLASDLASQSGFKSKDRYFTNPAKIPPKPPQPDPRVQIAQIQAQAKSQADQANAQNKSQQIQLQHDLSAKQLVIQQQAEAAKNHQDAVASAQKLMLDHGLSMDETILNAVVKVVSAALMAKAQPEQIPADISAAEGALQ
jgi:hypothetical protein